MRPSANIPAVMIGVLALVVAGLAAYRQGQRVGWKAGAAWTVCTIHFDGRCLLVSDGLAVTVERKEGGR